jgi:hypothetical protein
MATRKSLHDLPPELLQQIFDLLEKTDLSSLNLAARWCYELATPLIWREVELTDCSTTTEYNGEPAVDQHDDTPLLKKLLILARKPWVASHVQTLTHRCHLPPPAIFNELPETPFSGITLSQDLRTVQLVGLAVLNLTKVHTLRIIFGHPNINDALIRFFFDKNRGRDTPVRRLWLENCQIHPGCLLDFPQSQLPAYLDFSGLESLRLRRLPMRVTSDSQIRHEDNPDGLHFNHARNAEPMWRLQNGVGGRYDATLHMVPEVVIDLSARLLSRSVLSICPPISASG